MLAIALCPPPQRLAPPQLKHVAQHHPFIQDAPQLLFFFWVAHGVPSDVFPPFGSVHGGGGGGGDGGDGGEGPDPHFVGVGPWTTVPLIVRLATE